MKTNRSLNYLITNILLLLVSSCWVKQFKALRCHRFFSQLLLFIVEITQISSLTRRRRLLSNPWHEQGVFWMHCLLITRRTRLRSFVSEIEGYLVLLLLLLLLLLRRHHHHPYCCHYHYRNYCKNSSGRVLN
jgi:hypothetical protein